MNDEFKKLSQGDVTRYVLENASSGGTSSGSVASVSMPVGGTRKRGDNLITQEADKKTEPPKTRNPVAKNASAAIGGGAAGAHKDKKKAAKQGQEKHKKPYMEALQARLDQLKSKVAEVSLNELSSDLLKRSAQAATDKRNQAMDPELHNALGGGYMNPLATHYDNVSQKMDNRAAQVRKKETIQKIASKIASPAVMRKMGMSGVAEEFNGEYDDEAGMAQSNLLTTARAVMGLLKTIKDRDNLPEWGQEKIAKAEMMLVSVWDYLQSQKAMGNDPQQGVAEALDSNFVGFMNKTLGQKADAPTDKSPMPDFMKGAPVAGLDSMGYKAALDFGMKTLRKLTPTQKTKLSIKGEDGVVNWLANQAKKQGLLITDESDEDTQGKFMQEDLDEVQDFLPEVFHDPAIKSWAFVLTDGEPLPKAPVAGPFKVGINPGITGQNGYANADWKTVDTLENLPDARDLAQGLSQKNPKQFVAIWAANGKSAGFYWPGEGWRGIDEGVAEGDYADGSSIKTPGSEDWKQQYQQAVMAVKNAKTQQEYEAASDRAGRIKDLLASKGIQVGAVLGQQGVAEGLLDRFINTNNTKDKKISIGDYTLEIQTKNDKLFVYVTTAGEDAFDVAEAEFNIKLNNHGKKYLESEFTKVYPKYQRKGIATMIYRYVNSLGYDVQPSSTQTDSGKSMWKGFRDKGVAEGSEDKIKQLKADHATAVHWSKNETSPQKREAARQKAEKIKAHLEKQYKQGVAEGYVPINTFKMPTDPADKPEKVERDYTPKYDPKVHGPVHDLDWQRQQNEKRMYNVVRHSDRKVLNPEPIKGQTAAEEFMKQNGLGLGNADLEQVSTLRFHVTGIDASGERVWSDPLPDMKDVRNFYKQHGIDQFARTTSVTNSGGGSLAEGHGAMDGATMDKISHSVKAWNNADRNVEQLITQGHTIKFYPDKIEIFKGGELLYSKDGNFSNVSNGMVVRAKNLVSNLIYKSKQGVAEGKADYNFDIEDLKRLERIRDLATMKAQAMALISKPSAKPMKPEKVEWFKNALERMNSPLKVIKMMYDLMLSGEGHSVIGTKSSMNPNNYRQRFGEQGVNESWKSKLGGAALAGAMALGASGAHADMKDVPAGGHNQLPDIVAHVKFKVGDKEVTKDINLGSYYRSPKEAAEELKNFLNSKGITSYKFDLERVKPTNNYLDNSPATGTGNEKPSIDTKEPSSNGKNTGDYMAKEDAYMESLENMLERSVSQAQHNLMVGVANNPQFAQQVKVKQKVGQEFANADVGHDISKLPIRVPKKK